MTLKDYLNQNKLSLKVFGDLCGLSAPTILRARDGTNCQRQSKIGPKGSAKCCHIEGGVMRVQP